MKQIENRNDIQILVYSFYEKIRNDALLGDIFNRHIPEEKWPEHLDKLTDFWETNLFGVIKFKGDPTLKHALVDKNMGYVIEQEHFGKWIQLWFETIDTYYYGEIADKAKNAARKMAMGQFLYMWKQKPENKNN